MNYIYDILLNFNRQLYDFFEWNINDNIIHVRKIPLYRIDSKSLLEIRDNRIKIEENFLETIKNKTEIFTNKDLDLMTYATLFTDGSSVIAIKFSQDGSSVGKSVLLVDEDVEVLDVSSRLNEVSLHYKVLEPELYVPLRTRKEQRMEKFVLQELRKSQKQHAYEKLEYLYFECFGESECAIEKILKKLEGQIKKGDYSMIHKIYDFFKLTSVQK